MIYIRRAKIEDHNRINHLLLQVQKVHAAGRPDLFMSGTRKYSDEELNAIIVNDQTPILVAVDNDGIVVGYAFCVYQNNADSHILVHHKTLYIDDLCVDEHCRGQHIGSALYDAVKQMARENGCYNVTLNVWSCNADAMKFYQSRGLKPQKVGMEDIL